MPRNSPYSRKSSKKKGKKGDNKNPSRGKRNKLPLDGLKVPSKKICRGRLTVGSGHPVQGGIYLKGLRSQFTERYALNDENTARRDEDLCRLIDYGLPQLRKTLLEEKPKNVNQPHDLFGMSPDYTLRNASRHETVAKGEEIDRVRRRRSPSSSFIMRSPDAASPGFRLPQHHFQHSAPRRETTYSDKPETRGLYLLPSPEQSNYLDLFSQLPSIRTPCDIFHKRHADDERDSRFCEPSAQGKRQKFTPCDHSTPLIPGTSVAPTFNRHEYTIEDGYLNFQEQLDKVLHDVRNLIIIENDLDDRQQLCEYYMRRLRSINDDSSHRNY